MTERELVELAARHRLDIAPRDLPTYGADLARFVASLERLDELAAEHDPPVDGRDCGAPAAADNGLNGWAWRCRVVRSGAHGPLSGRRVAVKDNIAVAGVPMRVGSSMLEGFVPQFDATLVERLLDAGAIITGKSECEALCFSSGSHTSASGPVRNPHDPSRSSGGSSSGSAVLLATGEVDLAIGSDSAGSIRTPSAYCGIYGLKPTIGLVPGSGVFPLERTLDCPGPMARTPGDLALLLDVIAGPEDGAPDPRGASAGEYGAEISAGVETLRVGVLEEGFGWETSEPEVDEAVRAALSSLGEHGATVEPVSVPLHRDAIHIWCGIAMEGALDAMVRGHGGATGTRMWMEPALIRALMDARQANGLAVSPSATAMILSGELAKRSGSYHYAVARRLSRRLAEAYDRALEQFDLLALPTNPIKPQPLPAPNDPVEVRLTRSTEPILNTCAFNVTGHPALSAPWARACGLPVGVMLVAPRYGERTLLRAGAAIEPAAPPTMQQAS